MGWLFPWIAPKIHGLRLLDHFSVMSFSLILTLSGAVLLLFVKDYESILIVRRIVDILGMVVDVISQQPQPQPNAALSRKINTLEKQLESVIEQQKNWPQVVAVAIAAAALVMMIGIGVVSWQIGLSQASPRHQTEAPPK